jgi:hypothetical protein
MAGVMPLSLGLFRDTFRDILSRKAPDGEDEDHYRDHDWDQNQEQAQKKQQEKE